MKIQTIEKEALQLEPKQRARLARRLLLSLDELSESELDQVWLEESGRRAQQVDRGDVELVPYDEVDREARTRLK